MRVTDASLTELARLARVRPPHIFMLWHYRKALGDRFSPEGFASFAQMELPHVERMLAVLPEHVPTKAARKARQRVNPTALDADWSMPEDWLLIGRDKRFWTLDVCRTEAERFVNWHRMKGSQFADWKAAWRNWIDGSRRENGSAKPEDDRWTPERMAEYAARLK